MIVVQHWDSYSVLLVIWASTCANYAGLTVLEQMRLARVSPNKSNLLSKSTTFVLLILILTFLQVYATPIVTLSTMTLQPKVGNKSLQVELNWKYDLIACAIAGVFTFVSMYIGSKQTDLDTEDNVVGFIRRASRLHLNDDKPKLENFPPGFIFKKLRYIYLGGFVLGIGLSATFAVLSNGVYTRYHMNIALDIGLFVPGVIIAIIWGSIQMWIYFRVLFVYPELELVRLGSTVLLSGCQVGLLFIFGHSMTFTLKSSVDDMSGSTFHGITKNVILNCVVFVACLTMMVSIVNMRMRYQNLARVVKQADVSMEEALANGSPSARVAFVAEYEELRGLDGTNQDVSNFNKRRLSKKPNASGMNNHLAEMLGQSIKVSPRSDQGSPEDYDFAGAVVDMRRNRSYTSPEYLSCVAGQESTTTTPLGFPFRKAIMSPNKGSPSRLFNESALTKLEFSEVGSGNDLNPLRLDHPVKFEDYATATKRNIGTTTSSETISTVDTGRSSSSANTRRTTSSRSMRSISSRSELSVVDEEDMSVEASVVVKGSGTPSRAVSSLIDAMISSPYRKSFPSTETTIISTPKLFNRPRTVSLPSVKLNSIKRFSPDANISEEEEEEEAVDHW